MNPSERIVLQKITPTVDEEEHVHRITSALVGKLNEKLEFAEAIIGGSIAKGTWLRGRHDIDIFVLFDYGKYKDKSDLLSDLLEPVLKEIGIISRLHGSRDYFQIEYNDLVFEIVPILQISRSEEAINITDVSPLHAAWVNQNTRKLKDQIRLAKEFCKAHKLYGAESYIQGFSGYVLEILIVQYGSFVKLLQASARWTKKKVIDVEDHYPKKDALFHLNQSKTISPIVVVDPVDKLRNAAAALSEEKISLFKEIAKKYLVEPSETFFEKVILTADTVVEKAQKLKGHAVVIKVEPVEGKEDVVGAKLLKAYRFLSKQLDVFGMKEMDWQWEENAEFFFIIANDELPESELRIGPPTEMADACILFRQKHVDAFEQEGRLVANIAYPIRDLTGYVKDLLKAGYIKERVAKVIDFSTN